MRDFYSLFDSLSLFYGIHAIISAVVAYIAMEFLKKRYEDKKSYIFIFIWTFSMVLPIVGYFMVAWMVYYLLTIKHKPILRDEFMINMDEFISDFPKIHRSFGEAGIGKLLTNEEAPEELKLKALTSLSDNAKKSDIEMIKKMLGDRDDEVRLYSFSIINKLERNLNNKIHEKLKEFREAKDKKRKLQAATDLAHLYWDLVYYQLSDEDLKGFIIKEVEKYATYVLHRDSSNPQINLLLGKVYLYQKKYNNAQLFITTALKKGVNRDFIIPYLAEIFYEKRQFHTVKKLLSSAKDIEFNTTLYPIVILWRGEK
jgi:tetratricopeptide (TPR) repeat protein